MAVYGSSHTISLAEAKHDCQVELLPTPEATQTWNEATGAVISLLQVTR